MLAGTVPPGWEALCPQAGRHCAPGLAGAVPLGWQGPCRRLTRAQHSPPTFSPGGPIAPWGPGRPWQGESEQERSGISRARTPPRRPPIIPQPRPRPPPGRRPCWPTGSAGRPSGAHLHFYILTVKNQKDKLKNQSHSPLQQKNKISRNKLTQGY